MAAFLMTEKVITPVFNQNGGYLNYQKKLTRSLIAAAFIQ